MRYHGRNLCITLCKVYIGEYYGPSNGKVEHRISPNADIEAKRLWSRLGLGPSGYWYAKKLDQIRYSGGSRDLIRLPFGRSPNSGYRPKVSNDGPSFCDAVRRDETNIELNH